ALRFECGSLNTVGVYGLGAAIDLFLEVGTEQIEEYVVGLSRYLGDRLTEKGYVVAGSRNPGEMSAVVTCTHEKHSPANLSRQLRAKNIITAPRVKRLRIAPHFYNTRDEIDTLIDVLPS